MDDNPATSVFQSTGIRIDSPLQNQEEDEDIEEQKRRQEEIQNFLTNAMDEFNYDEQSTINSSTNVSVEDTYNKPTNIMQKYKNASLDDQLKVLYEVRVKEVKLLNEQLEQLNVQIAKQKDANGKAILLLEAEKGRSKISSEQSRILLASKTEEITNLKGEVDCMRGTIASLETTIKAINDEYSLCKQSNKELIEQLALMHNGLTTNTISDRQLQEQHHSEISHLHHLLDSANMKLHRKEREFKQLEQKLKETQGDKEMILTEKSSAVNQLTQNLESALDRCQEFSHIIETLSQENKTLKLSTTSDITNSIKCMGLADKTEIVKALQRQLDKTEEMRLVQESEVDALKQNCEKLSIDCRKFEMDSERYKNELDMWRKKYMTLEEDLSKNYNIKILQSRIEEHSKQSAIEYKKYEQRIQLLEAQLENYKSKENNNTGVQTSFITQNFNDREEYEKLQSKIGILETEIEELSGKLLEAENHVSLKVSLERERENLIKSLQEKALRFEEIIKQKQTKPESISVGVNTENVNKEIKEDLLQTKFETELVQKEIEIRNRLKEDFDLKFENLQKEILKRAQLQDENGCQMCKDSWNNLKQVQLLVDEKDRKITSLKEQTKQDREAVAVLLEEWRNKFQLMENEKHILYSECHNLKETCQQLLLKLKAKEVGDIKLYEVIKKECEETIKAWNKNTLENLRKYSLAQQQIVDRSSMHVEDVCKNADLEVHAIELQFLKKKQSLEQSILYNRHLKHT